MTIEHRLNVRKGVDHRPAASRDAIQCILRLELGGKRSVGLWNGRLQAAIGA